MVSGIAKSMPSGSVMLKVHSRDGSATPSNCGDPLKPLDTALAPKGLASWHHGEIRGYGKSARG